jgi:hypothetical protein
VGCFQFGNKGITSKPKAKENAEGFIGLIGSIGSIRSTLLRFHGFYYAEEPNLRNQCNQ